MSFISAYVDCYKKNRFRAVNMVLFIARSLYLHFRPFLFGQSCKSLSVLLVFSRSQFFTLLILSTASLFLMYYLKIFNSLIQLPDILWIFSSPFCNYHGGLRSLKREWIGANLLMLFSVLLGFREGHREGLCAHFCSCVLCC